MHWADKIAESLIEQFPDRTVFNCASGTTPSGPVHVGNLRDILTNWFVARCLVERGRQVNLIHSWDDYDRFRKVPKNVPDSFEQYLGRPLVDVPDPWGEFSSYAERYESIFERSLLSLGIRPCFRYQAAMYRSQQYNAAIVRAIERRGQIYDIVSGFRTQKGTAEERAKYFPVEIYCDLCHKDTTKILTFDDATMTFTYRCACGFEGSGSVESALNLKLPWKIDWAMRWRHEDIVFEPGGKDHGTAGGSYEVASEIAKHIFDRQPPVFQVYEFVGIKNVAGKMSSSAGTVITLDEALRIYQPEVLLWIFARTPPNRAFDLALDKQIYKVYDEFDRALTSPASEVPIADRKAVELSAVPNRTVHPMPFRQLASFAGIVRGNKRALEEMFERLGSSRREHEYSERLEKAEYWLHAYAPEEDVRLVENRRSEWFEQLPSEHKRWIGDLCSWLKQDGVTVESATERLYSIPQGGPEHQKAFFRTIYNLLFDRDSGPRLATFLAAVPKEDYLRLLDFSSE